MGRADNGTPVAAEMSAAEAMFRPIGTLLYGRWQTEPYSPPSVSEVKAGFDPQLPLSGLMLAEGAFDGQGAGPTEALSYIRLKGAGDGNLEQALIGTKTISALDYISEARELIENLIIEFDKVETGYTSQPRVKFTHDYGDYDHLARRDEWMRLSVEEAQEGKSQRGGSDD